MGLTTNNTLSGIVTRIIGYLPPLFTREVGTVLYNFFSGIASGFSIPLEQVNDLYDKVFLQTAANDDLDIFIGEYTKTRRKNEETDADYRQRYLRYVFEYNVTPDSIRIIVEDIMGARPIRLVELGNRNAYWGEGNRPLSGQVSGTASYYNDIDDYTKFWAGDANGNAFVGYIYLEGRPPAPVLDELNTVLDSVRALGTTIYLVYPNVNLSVYDDENTVYDEVNLYS